ncbi:MAG: hypothetical protein ACI4DU_00440 [Lachnospiraceae bacterium]
MNNSEMLLEQVVTHKFFGKGIIRSVDEKYLEVYFEEREKVSKFEYPSCFYGFLVMENRDLQDQLENDVEKWKEENDIEQKEELKKRYKRTMQGIEKRRIAAIEKKRKDAEKALEARARYNNAADTKKTENNGS